MEPNSPKKIQFVVPPLQNQLDPQAAEQIRRRRPTPATLALYSDPTTGESGDKQDGGNPEEAPTGELSRAQRKHGVYMAPTMRELQLMTEPHLQQLEQLEVELCENVDPFSPITAQQSSNGTMQWANQPYPEMNGSDAYGSLLLCTEEHPGSRCTEEEPPESLESKQKGLSSPSAVSR